MKRVIFAACAGLALAGVAPAVRAAEPTIPEVATVEDLRATTPLRLPDGRAARIGLADSGSEGGPWVLLYCLADAPSGPASTAPADEPTGHDLGPFKWRVDDPQRQELVGVSRQLRRPDDGTPPREELFVASVPVAWPGEYPLSVVEPDGKAVMRRTLRLDKPRPCYWHEFGGTGGGGYVVLRDATAALPRFDGGEPVARFGADGDPIGGVDKLKVVPPKPFPLPGLLRGASVWAVIASTRPVVDDRMVFPCELRLEEGSLVLTTKDQVLELWPDLYMLARWWVNDRPVEAPKTDHPRAILIGRLASLQDRVAVRFALPATLGRVRIGDRVGVQVLYCPAGISQLTNERGAGLGESLHHDLGGYRVPLLSNRIDFPATEAMLAAKD